jgi:prophage tail gpP-like protein
MPSPDEVATLIVNGQKFEDWKTVMVQHRWAEPYPIFNFSMAERPPIPSNWSLLQFKPGDRCEIALAGQLAVTGFITIRQVAYDDENHGVQLIGSSITKVPAKSSVRTKTGSFDGYSWEQIARSVLSPFGVTLKVVGSIDATPFEKCQHEPGELAIGFLERLARMRGIIVGSDAHGSLLGIGDHVGVFQQALVEGQNIQSANCIISNEHIYRQYFATGQHSGDDQTHGQQAAEIEAEVGGTDPLSSVLVTPVEQPDKKSMVQKRAAFEARWHQGTEVQAEVTVQGWLADGESLWQVGSAVWVRSPMLMLDMPLKIKTATFVQNENGTTTTLELVLPWFLNDHLDMSAANIKVPPPGAGAINPPE